MISMRLWHHLEVELNYCKSNSVNRAKDAINATRQDRDDLARNYSHHFAQTLAVLAGEIVSMMRRVIPVVTPTASHKQVARTRKR